MAADLGTKVDIGNWTVCCELDSVVNAGAERGDKEVRVVVEFGKAGDGAEDVSENILVLGAPDFFAALVDDCVLVLRSNGLKRRLVQYVVFGKNKLKCEC